MPLSDNLIKTIKNIYTERLMAIEYEKHDIALFYDECLDFIEQIFSGHDIDTIEVDLRPVVKDYIFLDYLTGKQNQNINQTFIDRTMKNIEKVDTATPSQQYIIRQLIRILNSENYKLPNKIYDRENKNYVFLMKVHFHKILHKFYAITHKHVCSELIDKYNTIASNYKQFDKNSFGNNAMLLSIMFEKNAVCDVKKIIIFLEGILDNYIDFNTT